MTQTSQPTGGGRSVIAKFVPRLPQRTQRHRTVTVGALVTPMLVWVSCSSVTRLWRPRRHRSGFTPQPYSELSPAIRLRVSRLGQRPHAWPVDYLVRVQAVRRSSARSQRYPAIRDGLAWRRDTNKTARVSRPTPSR